MELVGEIQSDSPIKQFPLSIDPLFQRLHLVREESIIERKPQTQKRIRVFRKFIEPRHVVERLFGRECTRPIESFD